jgi:hypothetical protein
VFGSECGEHQANIQTAWDALRLLAYGIEPRRSRGRDNAEWNRLQLRKIDLHWHDLRHYAESVIMPRRVPEAPVCGEDPGVELGQHAA